MGDIASARAARLTFIALTTFVAACRGGSAAHSEPRPVASPGEAARGSADCASSSSSEDAAAMHWSGKGSAIEVRARNGAVRAMASKDDTIDIVARRRSGSHAEAARLRVLDRGGVLVACVVTGEDDEDDADACDGGGSEGVEDGAIDIEVRVPRNVRFAGWTANGAVETEHLEADVEAHAQNGSITLDTSGIAQASTVNGSIVAKIGARRWDGTVALETVNGEVRVDLPDDAGARLSAETVHGKIGIGMKLEGARVEETRVEGRIGEGGGGLRLRSVNGGIEVY